MKANHTPIKWEFARTDQFDHSIDIFESATSRTLARTINSLPIEEAEANAEFICRAVNSHAQLVRALTNLEAELHRAFDDVPAGVDAWMAEARTALAAASPESAAKKGVEA